MLGNMERLVRRVMLLVAALALGGPATAQAAVSPLGLSCTEQEGVRLCQGAKVKTFDAVPLDVDVALPATGDANLPLVVQLHGWGGRRRPRRT